MLESEFQHKLIKRLKELFPGCIVLKNDSAYKQGIPDITIFFGEKWATLECKKSSSAPHRPNQEYYVDTMNDMGYSAFIYPENRETILDELVSYFCT